MDVSAVTHSNRGGSMGSYRIMSVSYSTTAEIRVGQDPAEISKTCTVVVHSNRCRLLLLPTLSCSALAGVKGHVLTSPASISACEVTIWKVLVPAKSSPERKGLQSAAWERVCLSGLLASTSLEA